MGIVNDQDDVIEYGTLWVDENGVTLHFDGSGDTLQLDRTVSGDLIDSVNGVRSCLWRASSLRSRTSQKRALRSMPPWNGDIPAGRRRVCSYSGLGDGYNTDDCYWEITKNGDYTHDGIRELHFDAICYIPEDSIPTLTSSIRLSPAVSSMTSTPV